MTSCSRRDLSSSAFLVPIVDPCPADTLWRSVEIPNPSDPVGSGVKPCEPRDDIMIAAGELKFRVSSAKAGAANGVDDGCEEVLMLWECPCPDAGVFIAGDLWERLRTIAAEVGGRGEGITGVGVAMEVFFGVEPECGLPALGVAIAGRG